jgi:hypothetical protein
MHKCGRESSTFGLGSWCDTTVPLIQYDNSAEKEKVAEKIAMRHFPHFIYKFMKLFLWTISKTTWKNWASQYFKLPWIFYEVFVKLPGKIGPVNISKTTLNVSKTTWKFWPPQYFQVVLEIFPSSFGNVSCIENAFGTVWSLPATHYISVGQQTFIAVKAIRTDHFWPLFCSRWRWLLGEEMAPFPCASLGAIYITYFTRTWTFLTMPTHQLTIFSFQRLKKQMAADITLLPRTPSREQVKNE